MKKVVRKNQIIITALALLIAVAGYVSYTQTAASDQAVETAADEVADTYEISDEDTVAEIFTDTEDNGQTAQAEEGQSDPADGASGENGEAAGGEEAAAPEGENAGETVLTSAGAVTDFAAEVKLNREQVRSKNKETLLDIINNSSISEAQKQDAVDEMVAMTDVAERENAAELLLEAKGFTDVVVSITDELADVVLDMGDVTDAKRAQVEDIVKRKTGIAAEHIVITPITQ